MIVFIVPLKSSKVSTSWETTSYLFERTIRSICTQTCDDFRVIVVCNEKPITQFDSPFVEYIETELPVPGKGWFEGGQKDHAKKLMIGLESSQKFNPSHIMVVDADDLISNKIAAFLQNNSEPSGWILQNGYIHEFGSSFLYYIRKDFVQYCGSSIIIKPNLFNLLFENNVYEHKGTTLAVHGVILENLPFCGGIYSRGNGENTYAQESIYQGFIPKGDRIAYIKHLLRFRPITAQIRKEFGFYEV
jgi:hypothetical protein